MKFNLGCVDFFVILLTLLFITLKFLKIIVWSWWWVLSPLWISFAIFSIILIVFLFIACFE